MHRELDLLHECARRLAEELSWSLASVSAERRSLTTEWLETAPGARERTVVLVFSDPWYGPGFSVSVQRSEWHGDGPPEDLQQRTLPESPGSGEVGWYGAEVEAGDSERERAFAREVEMCWRELREGR